MQNAPINREATEAHAPATVSHPLYGVVEPWGACVQGFLMVGFRYRHRIRWWDCVPWVSDMAVGLGSSFRGDLTANTV